MCEWQTTTVFRYQGRLSTYHLQFTWLSKYNFLAATISCSVSFIKSHKSSTIKVCSCSPPPLYLPCLPPSSWRESANVGKEDEATRPIYAELEGIHGTQRRWKFSVLSLERRGNILNFHTLALQYCSFLPRLFSSMPPFLYILYFFHAQFFSQPARNKWGGILSSSFLSLPTPPSIRG